MRPKIFIHEVNMIAPCRAFKDHIRWQALFWVAILPFSALMSFSNASPLFILTTPDAIRSETFLVACFFMWSMWKIIRIQAIHIPPRHQTKESNTAGGSPVLCIKREVAVHHSIEIMYALPNHTWYGFMIGWHLVIMAPIPVIATRYANITWTKYMSREHENFENATV